MEEHKPTWHNCHWHNVPKSDNYGKVQKYTTTKCETKKADNLFRFTFNMRSCVFCEYSQQDTKHTVCIKKDTVDYLFILHRIMLSICNLTGQMMRSLSEWKDDVFAYHLSCTLGVGVLTDSCTRIHKEKRLVYSFPQCRMKLDFRRIKYLIECALYCSTQIPINIHYVDYVMFEITRGHILTGGSPDKIKLYKKVCHPAVCVCCNDGVDTKRSMLCHAWYFDSLLGGETDIDKAHPLAIYEGHRSSDEEQVPMVETILKVADDVVWGGAVHMFGIKTEYPRAITPAQSKDMFLAKTCTNNHQEHPFETISIHLTDKASPQQVCSTALHELAHCRQDIEEYGSQEDDHGTVWLARMNDIQRHLAPRLCLYPTYTFNKLCSTYIVCMDCLQEKHNIPNKRQPKKCPFCDSKNIAIKLRKSWTTV